MAEPIAFFEVVKRLIAWQIAMEEPGMEYPITLVISVEKPVNVDIIVKEPELLKAGNKPVDLAIVVDKRFFSFVL